MTIWHLHNHILKIPISNIDLCLVSATARIGKVVRAYTPLQALPLPLTCAVKPNRALNKLLENKCDNMDAIS